MALCKRGHFANIFTLQQKMWTFHSKFWLFQKRIYFWCPLTLCDLPWFSFIMNLKMDYFYNFYLYYGFRSLITLRISDHVFPVQHTPLQLWHQRPLISETVYSFCLMKKYGPSKCMFVTFEYMLSRVMLAHIFCTHLSIHVHVYIISILSLILNHLLIIQFI